MACDLYDVETQLAPFLCFFLGVRPHPNSGTWIAPVRSARRLLLVLKSMLLEGHYLDEAMLGLALLQRRAEAPRLVVDSNATIFVSQFAYQAERWERPACFSDYFNADGQPPRQIATGDAPFFLNFNGPSGKWRHGWCTELFARSFARKDQHLFDVDGRTRRMLPSWCGGAVEPSGPAALAAKGHAVPKVRECKAGDVRMSCTNDRCRLASEERAEERRARKPRREGNSALVVSQHLGQPGGGHHDTPPTSVETTQVGSGSKELAAARAALQRLPPQAKEQLLRHELQSAPGDSKASNNGAVAAIVGIVIAAGALVIAGRSSSFRSLVSAWFGSEPRSRGSRERLSSFTDVSAPRR